MKDEELIFQLRKITENLNWISETDSLFSIFLWEGMELTPEQILKQINLELDTPYQILELEDFFASATEEQDWHNQEEAAEVKRYQTLLAFLKVNLSEIKVYKIGINSIDIYIVGKTQEDRLAGLSTTAVET